MLANLAAIAVVLSLQSDANLDLCKPFEAGIPHPEKTLGYALGSKITTYRDQERVYDALVANAKGRVKRIDYGKSNQGFPLRVYAISSAKNLARWEEIKKLNEAVANGKAKPSKDLPSIVWINECIHGNEPASFESGMALAYNLLAGKGSGIQKSLENVVVILNPVYNPDGHERFAVYYNSVARGSSDSSSFEYFEPSSIFGRVNQYRFDMNRDRVSFSQVETRQEVALFNQIRPHVYVDQHGQVLNYFFPPNPMSVNGNTDRDRVNKWTDIFGKDIAKTFDETGWSYFVRTDFDLYYPGYLDSYTTLCGAIGMTHETDGGKQLNKTRSDGSIVSLREGVAKHLTSALSIITTAAKRQSELTASYADYKAKAVSGEAAGKFQRVVVVGNPLRDLKRLKAQLDLAFVKSAFTTEPLKQKGINYWTGKEEETTFPAGSLVVDMNQENGLLAKTLLEPQSQFESKFIEEQLAKKKTAPEGESYPGPDDSEFYDLTGWALPYAHGLKAWYCDSRPPVKTTDSWVTVMGAPSLPTDVPAYTLEYTDVNDALAIYALVSDGVKVGVTSKPMKVAGKTFAKGTFVVFRVRNDADLTDKLRDVGFKFGANFEPLSTSYPDGDSRFGPGNSNLLAVAKPKIGVVFGTGANLAAVSGIWYTLEQELKLPFTALSGGGFTNKLWDYTVLIAPAGSGVGSNSKVKEWVRDGGILISLGDNSVVGSSGLANLSSTGVENRPLPGALFRASLEPRSLLTSGYPFVDGKSELAVPLDGSTFYRAKKEGGSVVRLSADEKETKLLTGWTWGDETEKALRDSVFLQDEPSGQGHVIWFASDPTERAMWPGLHKLLLNAILLMRGN